jgi:hypothetical protein
VSTPAPLDDRARWLLATLHELYGELAPEDWPVGVSITALTPEGQIVTYGLNVGQSEITRFIADAGALAEATPAIEAAFADAVTDATVRDAPP